MHFHLTVGWGRVLWCHGVRTVALPSLEGVCVCVQVLVRMCTFVFACASVRVCVRLLARACVHVCVGGDVGAWSSMCLCVEGMCVGWATWCAHVHGVRAHFAVGSHKASAS